MVLLFELTSDRKSVHVIDEVDEAQNTDCEPFFGGDIAESWRFGLWAASSSFGTFSFSIDLVIDSQQFMLRLLWIWC